MENLKKELEIIFRESSKPEELFDAFKRAIDNKVEDLSVYKILLGNIALNIDELKMYTEKICDVFPNISSEILHWSGSIIESDPSNYNLETAFEYYKQSIEIDSDNLPVYQSLFNLYNPDIDYPPLSSIEKIIDKNLERVVHKSKYCRTVASFYNKLDNPLMKNKFASLAAKFSRSGK